MNESIKTGRCQHVTNWLDLESLGSWPTDYAQNKNFPGSASRVRKNERKKNVLPIVLEESIEYTSDEKSKTERCQHVTAGWL